MEKKRNSDMPKPGPNSTYHKVKKPWEYWQYAFSPSVLIAERKIKWYDEDKLYDLWVSFKKMGIRFFWNEATENASSYTKHGTCIELYKKYPKEMSFQEKLQDMERIIATFGSLN